MTRYVILGILVSFVFMASQVQAQETSADFSGGSVKIGYDNQTCDGTTEGALRYDSSTSKVEFCDGGGSGWGAPGGTCTAPSGCTAIGDVCADGSQFAGFVVYGTSCEPLFVTNTNQSAASQWKASGSINEIATDSFDDGKLNVAQVTVSNFEAMNDCDTLSRHSNTDWYLPARDELHLLWANKTAINANAAANFLATQYWSSSEDTITNNGRAWRQTFGNFPLVDSAAKTGNHDVRCVRRD